MSNRIGRVLEAGHDAEGPVAARGLVSGRAYGRSPVGGMEREARKATEASSRAPGEAQEIITFAKISN